MEVIVLPHDPRWRLAYEAESGLIAAALGGNVVAVHHIGSTSIPNIWAKPIIDILVEVSEIDQVDSESPAMASLGYEAMGEFGISGRRYFRKDSPVGARTHQVHVFEARSNQIERHLAFRDYLTAHPAEAQQYSELKRALALRHQFEADAYMDGKDAFIKRIDRRAAQWLASRPQGK